MAFQPNPSGGAGHTIANGTSPWQAGVTFTITGHRFVQYHEDDKPVKADARDIPVFTCAVTGAAAGATEDLFLSMLRKGKVKADGGIIKPTGSLAQLVEQTIRTQLAANRQLTDAQLMQACVTACTGKTWLVKRIPYQGLDRDLKPYAAEFVEFVDQATGN